ncbi:hypothetical protein [Flaviflagellibacter deserti]|jgi:hypothetical protein|uniref:Secreted protein with PEP-CTERM sorting signal n=1 Tax=Flaviflagellibacter deserti TaxID=2267266 RepID=A0ABV9Z0R1_9HYPH
MRFLVRMIGVFLFAAAFVALVIDGTRSIAGNALYLSSLGESVKLVWPNGMEAIENSLRSLYESLWDPAGSWLFAQPAFVVLGLAGLFLMLIGRRRPRVVRPLPRRY